jgi:hypothetical protein
MPATATPAADAAVSPAAPLPDSDGPSPQCVEITKEQALADFKEMIGIDDAPVSHERTSDEQDAARYRWLRGEGFWRVIFDDLTTDLSDVGLDAAIDAKIGNTEE